MAGKRDSASILRPLLGDFGSAGCLSELKACLLFVFVLSFFFFFFKVLLNLSWLFQGPSITSLCGLWQREKHRDGWEQAAHNVFRHSP